MELGNTLSQASSGTGASTAPPEITVVIACHNTLSTLPTQLDALLYQQDAPSHEAILADNGSSDGLREWFETQGSRYPFLRYVYAGKCRGAGYARNVGVRHARAHKLAFCDGDDVVAPWWLRSASNALDQYALVTGSMSWGHDDQLAGDVTEIWNHFFPGWSRGVPEVSGRFVPAELGPLSAILAGGCFAISRDFYESLGGFDVAFDRGAEDNDLARRATDAAGGFMQDAHLNLVYRIPVGQRKNAKSYRYGIAAAQFCDRHNHWNVSSAFTRNPLWGAAKVAAGLPIAKLRGRSWSEENIRLATNAGLAAGMIQYKWLRRHHHPKVGWGLYED